MLSIKQADCIPFPETLTVLTKIQQAVAAQQLPFCLIGAQAISFWLRGVQQKNWPRKTNDVDLIVAVDSWPAFEQLKQTLLQDAAFRVVSNVSHKLYYANATLEIPVDIVPCGQLETAGQIAFPPTGEVRMNAQGLQEAIAHAKQLTIDSTLSVPVASLSGLALLKLMAWRDQRDKQKNDAQDLLGLSTSYDHPDYHERLYDKHMDLMEREEHVVEKAAARLLATDVWQIAAPATQQQLSALVANAAQQQKLLDQAGSGSVNQDQTSRDRAIAPLQSFLNQLQTLATTPAQAQSPELKQ